MSVLLKLMQIIPKSNPNTVITVDDDEMLNVKLGLEDKGSGLTVTLKNAYKKYIVNGGISLKVDDTLKLFLKYTDSVTDSIDPDSSDDLILSSNITEIRYGLAETKTTINLECTDKTYLMLNKLWAFNYKKSLGLTAPQIIKEVIDSVTGDGTSVNGTVRAILSSNGGYIEDVRQDNSAFPSSISMAKTYKPAYEWIKDLSQIDQINTTDELDTDTASTPANPRPMIFYIDENNNAHWEYPGTASANYEITAGEDDPVGSDLVSHKLTGFSLRKATFDMVNMVIFNVGDDFNGSGIMFYYFNPNADNTQLKPTFRPWIQITKDVMGKELVVNSAKYSKSDTGSLLFHNKLKYNSDYSGGGYKPVWADGSADALVTSDALLNASLRTYALAQGSNKSQTLTSRTASPRWLGSLNLKGYKYNVGNLIKFNSPLHGIEDALVRILTVQHTINKQGWFTNLTVEEDPTAYNT